MMICTVRFSKKKAVAILLAIAIILAAVILAMPERGTGSDAAGASGAVRTEEDQAAYLGSLGYQVELPPLECKMVVIPKQFDDVYTAYNEMQQECGFDLADYRGREVTLYTYAVVNYPENRDVLCDLLICGGRVIGGNLYTAALDGFMHGLRPADG